MHSSTLHPPSTPGGVVPRQERHLRLALTSPLPLLPLFRMRSCSGPFYPTPPAAEPNPDPHQDDEGNRHSCDVDHCPPSNLHQSRHRKILKSYRVKAYRCPALEPDSKIYSHSSNTARSKWCNSPCGAVEARTTSRALDDGTGEAGWPQGVTRAVGWGGSPV